MTTPKNVKELRTYLGMIGYLSKFIKNLSEESKVLRDLDKNNSEWLWKESHNNCYKKLNNMIANV